MTGDFCDFHRGTIIGKEMATEKTLPPNKLSNLEFISLRPIRARMTSGFLEVT
jgi:hypothetical protein